MPGFPDYSRSVPPQIFDRPGYTNELMAAVVTMDQVRTNAAIGTSKTVPAGKKARLTAIVSAWLESNANAMDGFIQSKLSITPSGQSIIDFLSPVIGIGAKSDNTPPINIPVTVILNAGDKVEGRASGTNTVAASARVGISWFYEEWDV